MRKIIIFNTSIAELNTDAADDLDVCKKYPGAEWFPLLREKLKDAGFILMSDVQALDLKVNFEEAQVIAEEWNSHTEQMYRLGAKITIGYCFESKMYAPYFYDGMNYVKDKVHNQYYFSYGNRPMKFPSYFHKAERITKPYNERGLICMVAANKQYWNLPQKMHSIAFQEAIRNELHSTRLELIETFSQTPFFHLFGNGWKGAKFPFPYESLTKVIEKLKPQPVIDKHGVTNCFRFAFAIENVKDPYYLTEKLIHVIAAGTVPVYLGDPMVHKYLPKSLYVDVRDFKTPLELYEFLTHMPRSDWEKMIQAGKTYLRSNEGKRHSFEYWADEVFDLLNKPNECGAV